MLTVANLDHMAKTSTRREKPIWGRKLAARRAELSLSLGDVEELTDGVVYSQLLYRLENGRMKPENVKAPQLAELLRVLEWTQADWLAALGQPIDETSESEEPNQPVDGHGFMEIPGGMLRVPVMGIANGGKPTGWMPVRKSAVRGANTRAFEVQGDSMAVGDRDGIRDGDCVLVDTSLTKPVNGKVFLLEIIGDGMTVKRLRQIEGQWLFISDNPEVGETWREDQVRIVGRVYGKVDYTEIL